MIIFINGSINSGKSTVSKILHAEIPDAALVEFDDIRHFIPQKPIDEAIKVVHRVGAEVIKSFVDNNFNVIVPYPLTKSSYLEISNELKDLGVNIYAFSLNPDLEKALTNRGQRVLDDQEIERIKYHYKIGINNPGYGITLDNTHQTPQETAEQIINIIRTKEEATTYTKQ